MQDEENETKNENYTRPVRKAKMKARERITNIVTEFMEDEI